MTFKCANIERNIRIEGSNVSGLRILPCCVYQTDNNYKTLQDYRASDEISHLQTATDWPAGCTVCKQQEQLKQTSYRQHANQTLENINGVRYEIFPSNICNLKCVMCSPANSSAFAQEQRIIGIADERYAKEFDISDEIINILDQSNNVESISLIGGEFFLAKSNLTILDFAITKNIPVRVVTNATVILPDHLTKLQQLNSLELQISCDGINEHYEFMRYPARWDNFLSNTHKLITSLPKAKINFHFVVQPLNAKNLIPSLEFLNAFRKPTRITNLVYPAYLSWDILTNDERNDVLVTMKSQLASARMADKQKQQINNIIDSIANSNYSTEQRQIFNNRVGRTMQHRKINLVEVVGLEPTINSV